MSNAISRFSFPTLIHFGPGARKLAPASLTASGAKRPLVVTDRGVAALPLHAAFLSELGAAGLAAASFSGVFGNPVVSQVSAGVEAFRAHGADAIVGLGGGAALDVAKAIALMVHHPGHLFDYEDDKPGALPFDQPIPTLIALPTTSGTGSEVGRSAVVSDDTTHVKKIIFSPRLLAKAVFADPELTLELPASVTASTGLDALTHNVEAYLAKGYHPLCDGIALEGLRLAAKSLEAAVKNGADLAARGDMMMSSMMGAIAFQKGLGVTHSCAHALGTVVDMHHGLANGVMIDFALGDNAKRGGPALAERFETMARTLRLSEPTAAGFLSWLSELKAKVGIPKNLSAAGVSREHKARLVELSVADGCHPNNPVPCAAADFERIFSEAFG
ncbi:MAG: iron-containing alcohol dehydrogenase [Polyangiaceae bacterium]|jgi:alcohol dehydrogenase class IV|nr:iron-containing alcohol dehydrogenase [Polyangiaceae bacterium]MBK8939927.1 iron-containing alcohol dehydrogenase [Polyangiaceae bacterium]